MWQDESPLSSRMIFTSTGAAEDHERGFAAAGTRCYACSFCGREFNSAQALGGHMNIHRRDRARLRTSASRTHQADLPPAPQNTPKSSHSTLYLPLEAASRDSTTSISSSLNTYQPPTIISATPTFKPLIMRSVADPALLAMAAPAPSHGEISAAFSVPMSDLVSFGFSSSSASSFSKIQNGAHSVFPNTDPHAASQLITPMLENSSFKRIQFSQEKGGDKRTRGNDIVDAACTVAAPGSFVGRINHDVHDDMKELNCLDLELRLGHSSPAGGNN